MPPELLQNVDGVTLGIIISLFVAERVVHYVLLWQKKPQTRSSDAHMEIMAGHLEKIAGTLDRIERRQLEQGEKLVRINNHTSVLVDRRT